MKWLRKLWQASRDTRYDYLDEWFDTEVREYNRKHLTFDYNPLELFV